MTAPRQEVSKLLEAHKPDGLTQTQTRNHTPRSNTFIADALKVLKAEGYVSEILHEHGRYPMWISVKPYREKTDPVLRGEPVAPEAVGSDH